MAIAEEDFHPAVRLLLARMRTDPEEFTGRGFRWSKVLTQTRELAQPHEKHELDELLRVIQLDAVHIQIMKILTQGEPLDDSAAIQERVNVIRMAQEAAQLQRLAAAQQQGVGLAAQQGYGQMLGNVSGPMTIPSYEPGQVLMLTKAEAEVLGLSIPSFKERLRNFWLSLAGKPKL